MDSNIPDKLYFKIGEVAAITGVKSHVLRYWESEFGTFRPTKSRGQQRLYRREDIELALRLKDLLHHQGYTIAGARKKLRNLPAGPEPQAEPPLSSSPIRPLLDEIRTDLLRLRQALDHPPR